MKKGWSPKYIDFVCDVVGLSPIGLAYKCDLETKATVENWRAGRGQPSAEQVSKMANAANEVLRRRKLSVRVNPNMLLGWEALPEIAEPAA